MKKKIEYYAISNSEGRHSFVVAHDGDLEKTISLITTGLMDEMCAEKVVIEKITELVTYESKEIKFKYFENVDDLDEDANESTFEIVGTAIYQTENRPKRK